MHLELSLFAIVAILFSSALAAPTPQNNRFDKKSLVRRGLPCGEGHAPCPTGQTCTNPTDGICLPDSSEELQKYFQSIEWQLQQPQPDARTIGSSYPPWRFHSNFSPSHPPGRVLSPSRESQQHSQNPNAMASSSRRTNNAPATALRAATSARIKSGTSRRKTGRTQQISGGHEDRNQGIRNPNLTCPGCQFKYTRVSSLHRHWINAQDPKCQLTLPE